MKRDILIISDSHGHVSRINELILRRQRLLRGGEVLNLIFLGDGLADVFACREYDNIIVHAVRGNCDALDRFSPYGEEIPLYRVLDIGGKRIFMCHGHTLSVKYGYDELLREASEKEADIVLFGHTHAPTLEYIKKGEIRGVQRNMVLFNPGSLGSFEGSFGDLSIDSDSGELLLSHGTFH